ncbi:MAG: GAF domain-containing protein [Bacteroidota bacterium]
MDKTEKYKRILLQLEDLFARTNDLDARMATMAALLHHKLPQLLWTGFYSLKDDELLVKMYQGPLACQVLKKNTGVCWTAINTGKTVIVPDVLLFDGHIACDPRSKSEIVVPVTNNDGKISGVLDLDCKVLNGFDLIDGEYLEKAVLLLHR